MASACPVCKANDARPFADKDGYSFVRCASCRFVYLDPMPDREDLNRLYETDDTVSADHYHKARSRRRRAFMKALRFRPMVRGRQVIDIGCGGGFMADALRRMGAEASGFDLSANAIAYARRHFPRCRFYCASYDDLLAHGSSYDFIYSSEVIEHVPDLDAYLGLLTRLARPGSRVYVTTPDIASPAVPSEICDWDVFTPPHHVQFFDETTLIRAMAQGGFRPLRRYTDKKAGLKILFEKA